MSSESVMCSFPLIVIILVVVWVCEESAKARNLLFENLHLVKGSSHRLRRIVYQFSLQMHLNNIEWEAFKMFKLNFNLLTSVSEK